MAQSNPMTPLLGTTAIAVTPSDTAAFPPSRIWCGGAGAVSVLCADGVSTAVFTSIPAGGEVPVLAIRVHATGTTATNIMRVA